jgi:hypothetical protein
MKQKYLVTNKLEQAIRFGDILFEPKETKELSVKPKSDRFYIERKKLEKRRN